MLSGMKRTSATSVTAAESSASASTTTTTASFCVDKKDGIIGKGLRRRGVVSGKNRMNGCEGARAAMYRQRRRETEREEQVIS